MGAPAPEMNPADDASAEALLSSLRTIAAAERRKHASVFNYWLSIRRDREFPPIRDLDPLEISDAGPVSILVEMIGGGEDAELRHVGQAIKAGIEVEKISEAPNPSLLSCIASRLPVVAACREAFAFEDQFETADGKTRCWVTLLPFSANGTWIDYVYGFVSLDPAPGATESAQDAVVEPAQDAVDADSETSQVPLAPLDEAPETEPEIGEAEPKPEIEPEPEIELEAVTETEVAAEAESGASAPGNPGFSTKILEKLANVGGFYGAPVAVELDLESASLEVGESGEDATIELPNEPIIAEDAGEAAFADEPLTAEEAGDPASADEPVAVEEIREPASDEAISMLEGPLQSKLTEVRAKADEARQAKLRANTALYEGLSAAYDFALDAEDHAEEYLKLVEAQGLKIQLRSPMKPVVKLAFDGMCDDATIAQLEAVLAWAFKNEFPRGSLAEQIEAAGGVGPILNDQSRAA